MRKLLLCPPDYYGIEYEINPWMDRRQNARPELARTQWLGLRDKLQALGCPLQLIEPRHKLPDMVFTANAGLVVGRTFVRSNFRHPERQGEQSHFGSWFAGQGYEVALLREDLVFEGEGDALFCSGTLFCGYRFRSDIRSHRAVGELLGCRVISVELVQERFYHLDTCFCPLTEGAAIWFPAAFDEYGQRAIQHHIAELIEVAPEEANHFACNAVVVDHQVVLPEGCPGLCAALRDRGYVAHPLPMSEFLKAGGACKCLVLFVPQRDSIGE